MEYFITGATGFVGKRVAHRLLDDDHDVVADITDTNPPRAIPPAIPAPSHR